MKIFNRKNSQHVVNFNEDPGDAEFYLSRLPEITFAEDNDEPTITIPAFQLGEKVHDGFGRTHEISLDFAEKLKANFDKKIRGIDILTDWEHGTDVAKGKAASGQIVDMIVDKTKNQMLYSIKLTKEAVDDLKNKRYRYFSPSWLPTWKHNNTGEDFEMVPNGGGFTNRPIQKTLPAINFAEVTTEDDVELKLDDHGAVVLEARPDEREPGTSGQPENEDPTHLPGQNPGFPPPPQGPPAGEEPNSEVKMDPEQLKKLNEMFGLGADAKPEDLIEKANETLATAKKVSLAEDHVAKQVAFAEAYPEQHDWIVKKQKEERERKAVEFAENFTVKLNGRTYVPSSEVQEKLRETHLKLAEGEVAFAELQEVIAEAHASDLVELGERGTASDGPDGDVSVMSYEDAGTQFAELAREEVSTAKKENEEISLSEGLNRAAAKHPELAKKYFDSYEIQS